MEAFLKYRDKARQNIRVADHMLTMTFPLVKDPKLLLAVLENIYGALENAITCVLAYEYLFKRIPSYGGTFDNKFTTFKQQVVPRYALAPESVRFISIIQELYKEHKESSVEFTRKEAYVMSKEDYKLKTLTEKDLKAHMQTTKTLVHELLQLVSKNDARFK